MPKSHPRVVTNRRPRRILALIALLLFGSVGAYVLTQSNAETVDVLVSSRPQCIEPSNTSTLPELTAGDGGQCVEFLQWTLNNLHYFDTTHGTVARSYDVAQTGVFDRATREAVVDFQNRLTTVGCAAAVPDTAPAQSPPTNGLVEDSTWYFLTTLSGQPGFPSASSSCGPGNPLL